MSGALSLSLRYLAIMVPSADGTVSVLTAEREARIELALLIAFIAICLVARILRPESPPDRRETNASKEPVEHGDMWRRSTKNAPSDQTESR